MLTRSLRLAALTSLIIAGTATAASAPVTAILTPNRVSRPAAASIALNGPFPSGVPSSLSIQIQNGFTSSLKAVSKLCTASAGAAGTCPAASQIGTGSITASVGALSATVPLKLWLGAPTQSGDISTVFLYGSYDGFSLGASARVFSPSGGGLEILIAKFPTISLPGVSIDSLSFDVHAVRTVTVTTTKKTHGKKKKHKKKKTHKKTTYSFLTNPSTCTGSWTGTATVTYAGTPTTLPLTAPCTA